MAIRYEYHSCADCRVTFAYQVDDDGNPVLGKRSKCYQCQPVKAESAHIQVLRRQMRLQGRKPGAAWRKGQYDGQQNVVVR